MKKENRNKKPGKIKYLLAEVVTDLNTVLDLGVSDLLAVYVDGEMSIYQLHLVLEPLGHTDLHVGDVRAHRAHSSELLLGAKPLLNLSM